MFNHYYQDIDEQTAEVVERGIIVDELPLLQEIQLLLESLASEGCDHSVNVCSCFERQRYEYLTSYIKHLESLRAAPLQEYYKHVLTHFESLPKNIQEELLGRYGPGSKAIQGVIDDQ